MRARPRSGADWAGRTGAATRETEMRLRSMMTAFREWAANRYRPEKHYMRGPGPACAARARRAGTF